MPTNNDIPSGNTEGRPRAFRPKYEVHFLLLVADTYDEYRTRFNSHSQIPPSLIYKKFLAYNPAIATKLRVNGRDPKFSSFEKLRSVGRNPHKSRILDAVTKNPEK
jgi:hypothetical protein